jgi:hypothetical protein
VFERRKEGDDRGHRQDHRQGSTTIHSGVKRANLAASESPSPPHHLRSTLQGRDRRQPCHHKRRLRQPMDQPSNSVAQRHRRR